MQPQETPPVAPAPNYDPSQLKPTKKKKPVVLIVLLIITILAAGGIGYLLMQEKSAHSKTTSDLGKIMTELQAKTAELNEAGKKLEQTKYQDSIRAALQPRNNRECGNTSSIVFNITTSTEKNSDGSIKKRFGVGQFICNNGNSPGTYPIRFSVVQSYDDGKTWEFTYGSSTVEPSHLPNYIYNTDPNLFKTAYNNPSHN